MFDASRLRISVGIHLLAIIVSRQVVLFERQEACKSWWERQVQGKMSAGGERIPHRFASACRSPLATVTVEPGSRGHKCVDCRCLARQLQYIFFPMRIRGIESLVCSHELFFACGMDRNEGVIVDVPRFFISPLALLGLYVKLP